MRSDRYEREPRRPSRRRAGSPPAPRGEYGDAYEAGWVPADRYDAAYGPRAGRGRTPASGYAPSAGADRGYEEPRAAGGRPPRYGPEYGRAEAPGSEPREAPTRARFHGYGLGYGGGALRSRGSYQAGQLRSGLNPQDEFEFDWGEGYVGGRGYGGTNYDLAQGYRTGARPRRAQRPEPRHGTERPEGRRGMERPPPPRGIERPQQGARPEPGREPAGVRGLQGPARYGYGPYHERLKRRRRPDEEIRDDVDEALFYDTWVDADRIDVTVEDGVVTLRGTLPNYDELRYATDDAWDVDGVRGVRTELDVEDESATEALSHRREYTAGAVAEADVERTGRPRSEESETEGEERDR